MLEVTDVSVRFGAHTALSGVSLELAEGEVVALLGPSGSGKSTLLRVLAGLQEPEPGARVVLEGEELMAVPPHRRGVGLMFQDHALFPHLDVAENVAFGLVAHRVPRREREERVAELLALVGLEGFAQRGVETLSGGERQRVALARALAPRPRLLMLDEPFGQLDRDLAERLVGEVRALVRRLGITTLAVTHHHGDAFALGDRIAVVNAGRIEQVASAQELWERPATPFVAHFLRGGSVVRASVRGGIARLAPPALHAPDLLDGEHELFLRPRARSA
jgi:thiamine transport system ATP-binding protein